MKLAADTPRDWSTMKLTLFVRTYPVKDAPVALSLVPYPTHQVHTFTRDGKVYNPVNREMSVTVPDGASVDVARKLLFWTGDKGLVKSTVNEVYALVEAKTSGFGKG